MDPVVVPVMSLATRDTLATIPLMWFKQTKYKAS